MTKLTAAQTYKLQIQADRRAAALERREGAIKADNARVKEMYKNDQTEVPVNTLFTVDQFDQIPDEKIRQMAYQVAALWPIAVPGVPFFGIAYKADDLRKGHNNWYLAGSDWPSNTPAMVRNNGKLTAKTTLRQSYRFRTVTVRTALAHIKAGRDLFAFNA